MTDSTITALREAAHQARRLSSEHQRAHRVAEETDASEIERGKELERQARDASAQLANAERALRAEAVVKRREARILDEAALQGRLRADALARSEKNQPPG